jgi:Barstar (barnase inhibitor)
VPIVRVPTKEIEDRATFHDVFARILGFPDFYGRNMDAWIDCLTSADDAAAGMIAPELVAGPGDVLTLDLEETADFAKRCPAEYADIIECSALVNRRRIEIGERPILALAFDR